MSMQITVSSSILEGLISRGVRCVHVKACYVGFLSGRRRRRCVRLVSPRLSVTPKAGHYAFAIYPREYVTLCYRNRSACEAMGSRRCYYARSLHPVGRCVSGTRGNR